MTDRLAEIEQRIGPSQVPPEIRTVAGDINWLIAEIRRLRLELDRQCERVETLDRMLAPIIEIGQSSGGPLGESITETTIPRMIQDLRTENEHLRGLVDRYDELLAAHDPGLQADY